MRRALSRALVRASGIAQRGKPDAFTSVVLTVPVFVLYHLGLLLIDKRNGVDWISGLMLALLDASVTAYVATTLGLAAVLALALAYLRARGTLRAVALAPVIAESVGWAILMLLSLGVVTAKLASALSTTLALGPFEKLVLSAGAGFHEEAVFRVLLLSGGARLLTRAAALGPTLAWIAAALGSALLFALAHHVGPFGEALTLEPLLFRTLAGLYLSLVYAARGFAVAVYTHTLYDLLVFFVLD